MSKRHFGAVLLLAVLLAGGISGTAAATEAEAPQYSEIVENASSTAQQFLPEPYERPGFFDWYVFPLIILGGLAVALVLFRYLLWQPRFAEEEEKKSRR